MKAKPALSVISAVAFLAGCGSSSSVQPADGHVAAATSEVTDESTPPSRTAADSSTNQVAPTTSVPTNQAPAAFVLSAAGYNPIDVRRDVVAPAALCCPGGIRLFTRADGTTIKASASDVQLGTFSDVQPVDIADASAQWSVINFSEGTGIVVVSRAASKDEAVALTASVAGDFASAGLGGLTAPRGFTEATGTPAAAPSLGTTIDFAAQSDRVRVHFASVPSEARVEFYDVPNAWTTQRAWRVLSIDTISSADGTTSVRWVEDGSLVVLSDRSGLDHALSLVEQIRPVEANEFADVVAAANERETAALLVTRFSVDGTTYDWRSDGQSPGWICRPGAAGAECVTLEYSDPSIAVFKDPALTVVGIQAPGTVTTIDSAEVSAQCDKLQCWFVAHPTSQRFKIHGERPVDGGADVTLDAELIVE